LFAGGVGKEERRDGTVLYYRRIQEVLRDFGTATVYLSLDLKSGYWQIPMDQASKTLTAFATPDGARYQYRVIPFNSRRIDPAK
jgi:hypothetical protein